MGGKSEGAHLTDLLPILVLLSILRVRHLGNLLRESAAACDSPLGDAAVKYLAHPLPADGCL